MNKSIPMALREYELNIDGCNIIRFEKLAEQRSYPFKYVPFLQSLYIFYEDLFSEVYSISDSLDSSVEQKKRWLLDVIIEEEYVDLKEKHINYKRLVEQVVDNCLNIEHIINLYERDGETVQQCMDDARLAIASILYFCYGEPANLKDAILDRIEQVKGGENQDDEINTNKIVIGECKFTDETALKKFFINNLNVIKIKGRNIRLYTGEYKRTGYEYRTPAGNIDILAVDTDNNFIVFEFKVNNGNDKALGQLLRYMGYVKEKMANGKNVIGVIVARKIDDKLKYAIKTVENIEVLEYDVKFDLIAVEV